MKNETDNTGRWIDWCSLYDSGEHKWHMSKKEIPTMSARWMNKNKTKNKKIKKITAPSEEEEDMEVEWLFEDWLHSFVIGKRKREQKSIFRSLPTLYWV